VAVDDSGVGVKAARAAGTYVIGDGIDEDDRSAAHEQIRAPDALVTRLRELVGEESTRHFSSGGREPA
jgi:beta-phosphoglucomutase-like phosphatase (HAD superfamily)